MSTVGQMAYANRPLSRGAGRSVHLHPGHRGVVHVVVSLVIVIHGPDLLRIRLVRIHVHHPPKYVRMELSARAIARVFCCDGTTHPELPIGSELRGLLPLTRLSEIYV